GRSPDVAQPSCGADVSGLYGASGGDPAVFRRAFVLAGAWDRRGERSDVPLSSALYIELARTLGAPPITTDPLLARAEAVAELVG
ncbi:MAG TPA: hypothetical protein VIX84_17120, partial [Acidimicrobiales bacterium]